MFNEVKLVVELLKMGVKVSDSMNLGMNKIKQKHTLANRSTKFSEFLYGDLPEAASSTDVKRLEEDINLMGIPERSVS